ncbi:hypothetical protein F5148DRAFT_1150151 [Russula earlei]|uniref:Uncharacterized protein n=1 Tax=Russula earlei TaxID=71964 RepID=A0ACC0U5E5_9AGAM|nr:hypothetical protein F5148DRAFT_1150151 [Russula earlei]
MPFLMPTWLLFQYVPYLPAILRANFYRGPRSPTQGLDRIKVALQLSLRIGFGRVVPGRGQREGIDFWGTDYAYLRQTSLRLMYEYRPVCNRIAKRALCRGHNVQELGTLQAGDPGITTNVRKELKPLFATPTPPDVVFHRNKSGSCSSEGHKVSELPMITEIGRVGVFGMMILRHAATLGQGRHVNYIRMMDGLHTQHLGACVFVSLLQFALTLFLSS